MPSRNRLSTSCVWIAALMLCGLAGCHGWPSLPSLPPPHAPDIKPIREQRKREVVAEFEQLRNKAQCDAAQNCWDRGDHAAARELLQTVLERDPDYRDARVGLIEYALLDDAMDIAKKHADEAAERHPQDREVLEQVAAVYELIGESHKAESYVQRAQALVEIPSKKPQASQAPASKPRTSASTKITKSTRPSPKLGPTPSPAANASADAPPRLPEDAYASRRVVDISESAEPRPPAQPQQHPSCRLLAAEICMATGDKQQAATIVDDLLLEQPRNDAAREMAVRLGSVPRQHQAQAIAASPLHPVIQSTIREEPPARSMIAVVTDEPARLPESQKELHDSLNRHVPESPAEPPTMPKPPATQVGHTAPTVSDEWRRKAEVALDAGATASAARLFDKAVGSAETEQSVTTAAVTALRHAQPELAVQVAQAGLQRFPDSAALYRILGTAHYRLNDFEASQVALRQALSLDKTSALSYFLMGCTLSKLGDRSGADWHYRQAQLRDARFASR